MWTRRNILYNLLKFFRERRVCVQERLQYRALPSALETILSLPWNKSSAFLLLFPFSRSLGNLSVWICRCCRAPRRGLNHIDMCACVFVWLCEAPVTCTCHVQRGWKQKYQTCVSAALRLHRAAAAALRSVNTVSSCGSLFGQETRKLIKRGLRRPRLLWAGTLSWLFSKHLQWGEMWKNNMSRLFWENVAPARMRSSAGRQTVSDCASRSADNLIFNLCCFCLELPVSQSRCKILCRLPADLQAAPSDIID